MNPKIEITIETERVFIVSRRSVQGWCERCGRQVQLVRLAPDALAEINLRNVLRAARNDKLHLTEPPDVSLVICLDSLLENFNDE